MKFYRHVGKTSMFLTKKFRFFFKKFLFFSILLFIRAHVSPGAEQLRPKLISDDIVQANTTVVEATRSILEGRAGSPYTIHLLHMQFYLGNESIFISQIVANTIATQKVASVEFTILTKVRRNCSKSDLITYGTQFMSFFDSCPSTFGGLARLTLENLRLGESDFPKNFSICKQLEFLRLYHCDLGFMSLLEVEHPQLNELAVVQSSLKMVDLKWVPRLTLVKFNGFVSQLLKTTPSVLAMSHCSRL